MFGDKNLEKWTPDAQIINRLMVSQGMPNRNEKQHYAQEPYTGASANDERDEPLYLVFD